MVMKMTKKKIEILWCVGIEIMVMTTIPVVGDCDGEHHDAGLCVEGGTAKAALSVFQRRPSSRQTQTHTQHTGATTGNPKQDGGWMD